MGKKMTTEEFIRRAKEVHGDKYDYSKAEYVNNSTKICIICPEHGEFWQTPANHLQGKGCEKCVRPNSGLTTEEFIRKAKEVHGDKYDYSKVEYVNGQTKLCIICPQHGEFWQKPLDHLKGNGCPRCIGRGQTIEDFLKKAKEVHGDKYDYSKVKYVNQSTKLCIICPQHGEFWQKPLDHLNGKGCPKCGGRVQLTTEEFIKKAREIHGDKYDYSRTEYVNAKTAVCIICPIHGEFWQMPYNHLSGKGCLKCGGRNQLTTEEFICKAKEIHGDKYDYSKVKYVNITTKVCIICPKHGEFWQRPSHHLIGKGCRKCANEASSIRQSMGIEDFIRRAKEVHGDKYNYSKVEYVNNSTKVCIICPEHGEFMQDPSHPLNGGGCPKCYGKNKTTEEWIEEARKIHGDKYDYSKVEYTGAKNKVCIICPIHGEFWQFASDHIRNKSGCPCCNRGLTKQYKFNLLEEFESEYEFRAFLENNDENILYVILSSIEPKYEPLKRDIERALANSKEIDPIKALKEKYTSDSDDELDDDEEINEEKELESATEPLVDLDDDDAIDVIVQEEPHSELTIEDVVKNTEKEIKVINKIEHLLAPEIRKYIMDKFLNDKRRAWMLKRESGVK